MKIKKILALLTSTAMLAASLNVSAFAVGSGDVNSDGAIIKEDADLTMEYVLNPAGSTVSDPDTFDPNEAEVTDCHGVTAKDVAKIMMMAAKGSLMPYVAVTAGKVDGAKTFTPVKWTATAADPTKEAARKMAQDEVSTTSVNDFFNDYFEEVTDENFNSASRVNNFLEKVYLNDYKLTSPECKAWILSILDDVEAATGNTSLSDFIEQFYAAYDANGCITVSDAKILFKNFNAGVTISDADIEAIKNSEDFTWFRTNFQLAVYDSETESDDKEDVGKTYYDHYSNYGISVVDWYFFNNSEVIPRIAQLKDATASGSAFEDYLDPVYTKYSSPTDDQPFKDNVIDTLTNVIKPYLEVTNDGGTVLKALEAIGGDRIELTINSGELPDVAGMGESIDTYDEFVEEFGDFSDPTMTYYIDFSQLGYSFSGGTATADPTTGTTTEADTEATTEADVTTTEADTTTTEAQGEETTSSVYVLTPSAIGDTVSASTLLYEDSSMAIYAGAYGATAVKKSADDTSPVWQLTDADSGSEKMTTAYIGTDSYSGKFRKNCAVTAKTDDTISVTVIAQGTNKTFGAFECTDEATDTYTAVATVSTTAQYEESVLTWTATAGTTYYVGGNGTNAAILLPYVYTTSDDDAATTTEASAETTTDSATTTTEASGDDSDPYESLPTLASGTSIGYEAFIADLIGDTSSATSTSATDYAISGNFKDSVGKTYIRLKSGIGIIVKVGDNAVITVNSKSASGDDAAREVQVYSGTDATGTSVLSEVNSTSDYEDHTTGTLSAGFYFITASNGINVKSISVGSAS